MPLIVSSVPELGAREVPLSLGALRLEFNCSMDTTNWTLWKAPESEGVVPPLINPGKNPWIDERTCEFALGPLSPDTTYALQCNAPKRQGFRSHKGDPLEVTLFVFTTRKKEASGAPSPLPSSTPLPEPTEKPEEPREFSLEGRWKTTFEGHSMELYFSPEGTFFYYISGELAGEGEYRVAGETVRIIPRGEEPYSMKLTFTDEDHPVLEDYEARLELERIAPPKAEEKKEESPKANGKENGKKPEKAIPPQEKSTLRFPGGFSLYRCYDTQGFRDAGGKPLEVFQMLLPEGWQTEGGVFWKISEKPASLINRNDLVQPVELRFRAFSPEGKAGFRFYPEVWFADLSQAPAASFFPPGTPYGGLTSMPAMDPQSYILQYVLPRQGGIDSPSVVASRELPELAGRFDEEMRIFNRIGGSAGVQVRHRAGLVTVEYPRQGETLRETAVVVLRYLPMPGLVLWWSCSSFSAWAPAEEFHSWQPCIATSLNSFRPNLKWLVKLMAVLDQNLRGVAEVDARVRQIDQEITRHQAETNAVIHRQMYPLLAPFADFVGPDGTSRFLPTDREHQVDGEGNIRSGSNLPDAPGWQKLTPREHL